MLRSLCNSLLLWIVALLYILNRAFKFNLCVCSQEKAPITKLSRSEIQEELETATRKYLEQMILPNVVEVEGSGPLFDDDLMNFSMRIRQRLADSRKLQKDVEARIRRKMKKYGDEKRFLVRTPEAEVVKGFPEIEMKWMFGNKEVVAPKAIRTHLYHGWKKWREEAKADLKRKLLEDDDFARQYLAEKQVNFLYYSNGVLSGANIGNSSQYSGTGDIAFCCIYMC